MNVIAFRQTDILMLVNNCTNIKHYKVNKEVGNETQKGS